MRPHLCLCIAIVFAVAGVTPASPAHAGFPRPALRAPAAQAEVAAGIMSWTGGIRNFALGDWNGDGLEDLAVNLTEPGGPSAVMFQENIMATGSPRLFQQVAPPPGYDPPTSLDRLTMGDLNGDGRADFVMIADDDPLVYYQLSTPNGELGPRASLALSNMTGFSSTGPWIQDMDGDGDQDVLLSCTHSSQGDIVTILANPGTGALTLGQWFSTADNAAIECVGDLNLDGKPDMVAAVGSESRYYVYRSTATPLVYTLQTFSEPLGVDSRIGTADADALPDLIVLWPTHLRVYHGIAGGHFSTAFDAIPLMSAHSGLRIETGDLGSDSRSEVVVTLWDLASDNPHATLEVVDLSAPLAPHRFLSTGRVTTAARIAHLDRDDIPDLIVQLNSQETRNMAVLLGPVGQDVGIEVPLAIGTSYLDLGTPCVGDFNRDGSPDVAAPVGTTTHVLLGNGTGGFPNATSTGSVSGDRVFFCDLNRDAKPDLLRSERSTSNLLWQPGNGDGTFGAATLIASSEPTVPRHPIADLNGDGNDDLITFTPTGVAIAAGNGAGGIAAGYAPLVTGATPRDAVAVDMDRDGDLDLAVATDAGVRLFRNDGAPSFTYIGPSGNQPYSAIAAGDLNRDGRPDLVAHRAYSGTWQRDDAGLDLFHYDGAWTLIYWRTLGAAERQGVMIELLDADRDGWTDIVCSAVNNQVAGSAPVITSVFLQRGLDSWSPRLDYLQGSMASNGSAPLSAGGFTMVADADGDFQPDVLGFNPEPSAPFLSIVQGNAFPGGWGAASQRDIPVTGQPIGLATGDMDRDGILDLVTANYQSGTVTIFTGDGEGGYTLRHTATDPRLTTEVTGLALADMNRDGMLDAVAVSIGGPICVLLGSGGGLFSGLVEYPGGSGLNDVRIADLNRDGYPDIVASSYFNSTVIIHITGPSGFSTTISGMPGYNVGLAVADFNRDGRPDILVSNNASGPIVYRSLRIALGNGDGTFQTPGIAWSWPSTTTQYVFGVAVGDVNKDGKVDVVVGTNDQGHNTTPVYLVYGNGLGGFTSEIAYPAGGQVDYLQIGDLDGDPWPDLVASSFEQGFLSVRLGDGLGGFGERTDVGSATGAEGLVLADLDRDGLNDLAFTSPFQNRFSVLLNSHTTITAAPVTEAPRPVGSLGQNAPNPFNPRTTIRFRVPTAGRASLTIYDVQGRKVSTLADGEWAAGDHHVVWEGEDQAGRPLPSGVYFYRLESRGFAATRRMTLLR